MPEVEQPHQPRAATQPGQRRFPDGVSSLRPATIALAGSIPGSKQLRVVGYYSDEITAPPKTKGTTSAATYPEGAR
jgi:hypothetical protein